MLIPVRNLTSAKSTGRSKIEKNKTKQKSKHAHINVYILVPYVSCFGGI